MPNWKKVIVSGSDAVLNNITASNILSTGNVTIQGDLTAEKYIVSSSVTYMTQSFSSGSTIFGDTNDDTHQFTGSLQILHTGSTYGFQMSGSNFLIDWGNSGSVTLGEYNVGLEFAGLIGPITGSGLIVSQSFTNEATHHNMVKIGETELVDISGSLYGSDAFFINVRKKALVISSSELDSPIANLANGNTIFYGGTQPNLTILSEDVVIAPNSTTTISSPFTSLRVPTPGTAGQCNYIIGQNTNANTAASSIAGFATDTIFSEFGGAITASAVSSSGLLFASLSEDTAGSYNNSVVYDTTTGQFYYTGSYGSGGGTVNTTGTPSDNQIAVFTNSNTIEGNNNFTYDGVQLSLEGGAIFNTANDDVAFQFKGSSDNNLLQVNPQSENKVGIGTATPSEKLTIEGNISASGNIIVSNITASGNISSSGNIIASNITASGDISASNIHGTLQTAAQPNITSLGTLTSLTVDQLNLDGNTLSSTSDSEVLITLGVNGIGFEANNGDYFLFNSDQEDIDLDYTGTTDLNLFYIDASEDKIGIGTNTPGEKLSIEGNISASGDLVKITNITASNNISASNIVYGSTGSFSHLEGNSPITVKDQITFQGAITASSNISGSGTLFASLSLDDTTSYKSVMYDTTTGKFYYTGSYGSSNLNAVGVAGTIQYSDGSGGLDGDDTTPFRWSNSSQTLFIGDGLNDGGFAIRVSDDNNESLTGPVQINAGGKNTLQFNKISTREVFASFEHLEGHFMLHPINQLGSSSPNNVNTVITDQFLASSRLHVIDEFQPAHVAKIINLDLATSKETLLLGTAHDADSLSGIQGTPYHKFVDFHIKCGVHQGFSIGGIFFDPTNILGGGGNNIVTYQGTLVNPSDKKLKKNITDTKKGIDDIMSMKVKDYRWKKSPKKTKKSTGLIAQELQETHPELVSNLDDTLNVNYTNIVPILIKAVQDQQEQINELKKQLENKEL